MTKLSLSEIKHLVSRFTALTLPKSEWTHEAHLITGLSLLDGHGLSKAEQLMPGMIRAYNEATGVVNTDSEGYHHTITIFYLRRLEAFSRENTSLDLAALCDRLLAGSMAAKSYPLEFYSRERLFSVAARRNFVTPDLKPF